MWRPASRVVCLDAADRVLLMCWEDPSNGSRMWEPPGGGIEPGETPLAAARRELVEETGFAASSVVDRSVEVLRNVLWSGNRSIGPESFFLARLPGHRPTPTRDGLLPDENTAMIEYRWFSRAELAEFPARLEPPELVSIIAELTGTRP
jgi:8-oxo-dGTP pyrophosphatase MutT (NUDIX family)